MYKYNNIKDIIINKKEKSPKFIDADNKKMALIYLGRRYNSNIINNNYLRRIDVKGYLLDSNIYERFLDSEYYSLYFKKILYKNRYMNNVPVNKMLREVKTNSDYMIKKIYLDIPTTNDTFVNNTGLYNEVFFNNFYNIKNITILKEIKIFEEYLLNYPFNINYEGFTNVVVIPLQDWILTPEDIDYKNNLNPISYLLYLITKRIVNPFEKDIDVMIINGKDSFMKFNTSIFNDKKKRMLFKNNILKLIKEDFHNLDNANIDKEILSQDENIEKEELSELEDNNEDQKLIVSDDAMDMKEEEISKIVELSKSIVLTAEEHEEDKLTPKQKKFIEENDRQFSAKTVNGLHVGNVINNKNDNVLPPIKLDIESINPVWKNMSYKNFDKMYELDKDIIKVFNYFGEIDKSQLIITDISVEDTSTFLDYKYTWSVTYRNMRNATLFTIKVDMPKIEDDIFMHLGGNDKILGKQLFRRPFGKSNRFEAQLVSNYNKIFIGLNKDNFRSRTSSNVYKLLKVLLSEKLSNISITKGNNNISNDRFKIDIERYDIGTEITSIDYKDYSFKFNMAELGKDYEEIIGFKGKNKVLFRGNPVDAMLTILLEDEEFSEKFNSCKDSSNYIFSKAKLMAENFPIIFLICYYNGFSKAMKLADIEYEIVDKKSRSDNSYNYIKTADYYIKYKNTLRNSLLMSGLKFVGIDRFNVQDLEDHNTWIDMIELMGYSRLTSDGLDNFNILFIDPITKEVCEHYKLPTTLSELLIKASDSLLDTDFMEHGNIKNYRLRSKEQLAGYLYSGLSSEYEKFRIVLKKTGKGKINIKQNKIILMIMADKMFTDTSSINDLHTYEMTEQSSVKGLKGMNEARSFSLDKRSYDKSMNGFITGTTAFAGNVGMERQVALNCQINSTRGYFDENESVKNEDLNTSCLSMVDATLPFSVYSDDPFRQLMGGLQNNKHRVMVKESKPALITTGADKALPHLTRNLFSIKAKDNGKVTEVTDDHVIITYNNGEKEYITKQPFTVKDSGGGMFLELFYEVPLKLNQSIKADQIIAYDKRSYSMIDGEVIYNAGTLVKIALLNTEEAFEDSSVCSERLSEKLSMTLIKMKDVIIDKDSVITYVAGRGMNIKEGDPILIYQNAFESEETNALLSKLNGSTDILDDLGKIVIKSKYTGYIQDVKVYRTCEIEEMSESCKFYFKSLNKMHYDKYNTVKKNKIKDADIKYNFMEKQELTGKLKNAYDSLLFEFHIKTNNKFSNGDKFVFYTANKGVNSRIFPKGLEPTSEFRPDEIIDTLGSLSAINKRKVTSVPKTALTNKVLIELGRKCKDLLNIKYDVNEI